MSARLKITVETDDVAYDTTYETLDGHTFQATTIHDSSLKRSEQVLMDLARYLIGAKGG